MNKLTEWWNYWRVDESTIEKRKVTDMFIYMKDSPAFALTNIRDQDDFTNPWADFVNWYKSGVGYSYTLAYGNGDLIRLVTMSRDSISRIEIGEVYDE